MGSVVIYGVIGLLLPIKAFLIINQDWQFHIPFFGIIYKPWRLFLITCSLPGFLASLALFFIPESPKFLLSQGNQKETIQTLKKMSRWNSGKEAPFEIKEIFEETESIENRNRIQNYKMNRFPLISSVWGQTIPLFKSAYLRSTLLVCAIQFGIYAVCNGFYIFFAEILNRMAKQVDSFVDDRIEMCDIVRMNNLTNSTETEDDYTVLSTKLEISALEHVFILEALFLFGCTVMNFLINKFGKFSTICMLFTLRIQNCLKIHFYMFVFLAVVLGISGLGGVLAMLTRIPFIQIASFIVLMCGSIAGNVINAAIVEIYPTSCRLDLSND